MDSHVDSQTWALHPPCGFGVRLPLAKSQQSGLHDPCSLKDPGSSPGKDWDVWLLPTQKPCPAVIQTLWPCVCGPAGAWPNWRRRGGRQGRPLPVLAGGWQAPVELISRHLCPAVSSQCVCSTWWSQDKEPQALDTCPAAGVAFEARGISCDPGTQLARGDNTSSRPFLLVFLGIEEHSSTQRALRAARLCPCGAIYL